MRVNKKTSFLLGYFILNIIYWIGIQASNITDLAINLLFSYSTAVLALLGGTMGLLASKHWGGRKSAVGNAIFLLSMGTISWSIGNFIWSFYTFVLNQEMPYPSLADLGYTLAVPLWAIGIFYLSKATGAKFSLRKPLGRVLIILLPIIAAVVSYYFLFVVARDSMIESEGAILKIFLDFYYPIGDWIILTMSFLLFGLSLKYLGGRFRMPVFTILLGFIFMFLADFSFSFTTTVGSYYNGNISDLLFATALFIIGFGINSLDVSDS